MTSAEQAASRLRMILALDRKAQGRSYDVYGIVAGTCFDSIEALEAIDYSGYVAARDRPIRWRPPTFHD